MKLEIFILVLALSSALGFWSESDYFGKRSIPGRFKRHWGFKRDVLTEVDPGSEAGNGDGSGQDESVPDLLSQVDSLIQSAREGMKVEDMGEAANKVQETAESIMVSREGDPLAYEGSRMDAALRVLQKAADEARAEEDAGEVSTDVIAAIGLASEDIQNTLSDTVATVEDVLEEDLKKRGLNQSYISKRGTWSVSASYSSD